MTSSNIHLSKNWQQRYQPNDRQINLIFKFLLAHKLFDICDYISIWFKFRYRYKYGNFKIIHTKTYRMIEKKKDKKRTNALDKHGEFVSDSDVFTSINSQAQFFEFAVITMTSYVTITVTYYQRYSLILDSYPSRDKRKSY